MKIKIAESHDEKQQLDELLWRILWKPLDLPCDTREKFALSSEEIELIAVVGTVVVGAIVANWIGENELEIRHLAIDHNHQRKLIGTNLISALFNLIKKDNPVKVQTYVRITSYQFFLKQGFTLVAEHAIKHPDFEKHGINFILAERYI